MNKQQWLVTAYSGKKGGWAWVGKADSREEALKVATEIRGLVWTHCAMPGQKTDIAHLEGKIPDILDEPRWGVWELNVNPIPSNGLILDCAW